MLKTVQRRKFNPKEDFSKKPYNAEEAIKNLREMQRISELNGNSEMTLDEINAEIAAARRESATKALKALDEMNRIAKLNGTSEMTLDEINAEIYAARREREAREAQGLQ